MKNLIVAILIFCGHLVYSQDFDKAYYNAQWELTSFKYASYYRTSGFDQSSMKFDSTVTDYYMDGTTEMAGRYVSGVKEGDFIYYYPDHTLRLVTDGIVRIKNVTSDSININYRVLCLDELEYKK